MLWDGNGNGLHLVRSRSGKESISNVAGFSSAVHLRQKTVRPAWLLCHFAPVPESRNCSHRKPLGHGLSLQAMEKLKTPQFRLVDFFALGQGMPEEVGSNRVGLEPNLTI